MEGGDSGEVGAVLGLLFVFSSFVSSSLHGGFFSAYFRSWSARLLFCVPSFLVGSSSFLVVLASFISWLFWLHLVFILGVLFFFLISPALHFLVSCVVFCVGRLVSWIRISCILSAGYVYVMLLCAYSPHTSRYRSCLISTLFFPFSMGVVFFLAFLSRDLSLLVLHVPPSRRQYICRGNHTCITSFWCMGKLEALAGEVLYMRAWRMVLSDFWARVRFGEVFE